MENHPVLYSYRRCPYAMRARVGLYLCGVQVEQREIVFWDKPESMLQASPKGTVPVLILPNGEVIDESRDILTWAVNQTGLAENKLLPSAKKGEINNWIDENDEQFKEWLDKYKYADRYPENEQSYYRFQGEIFLAKLEEALNNHDYLVSNELTLADVALFPFIRQFVHVDKTWFASANYPKLKVWLDCHLSADYFKAIMKNRPVWQEEFEPLWLDEPELETRDQFQKKAQNKT